MILFSWNRAGKTTASLTVKAFFFASHVLYARQYWDHSQPIRLLWVVFDGEFCWCVLVWVTPVCFTERLSVSFPNLRLWWKILIWDLSTHGLKVSQSTLHQWMMSTHSHFTQRAHTYTQVFTHKATNSHTHWHTLHLPNQSEWSGVGPPEVGGRAVETEVRLRTHKVWRTFWLTVSQP